MAGLWMQKGQLSASGKAQTRWSIAKHSTGTLSCTMDKWKAATCTDLTQVKEKYNVGLLNSQHHMTMWLWDFSHWPNSAMLQYQLVKLRYLSQWMLMLLMPLPLNASSTKTRPSYPRKVNAFRCWDTWHMTAPRIRTLQSEPTTLAPSQIPCPNHHNIH